MLRRPLKGSKSRNPAEEPHPYVRSRFQSFDFWLEVENKALGLRLFLYVKV